MSSDEIVKRNSLANNRKNRAQGLQFLPQDLHWNWKPRQLGF